ncbi:MAG: ribosomal-processing cysteine protease Prp [Clostridia bacterium]|nr:ribosomal-processing cysteine protease Prp [Clostridia bacterium]
MTKVIFNKSCDVITLKADGHAGYNPGNDIVCSGISTLLCTLASAIESKNCLLESDFKEGHVFLKARSTKASDDFIEFTATGLYLMQREYPENIQVRFEGEKILKV